MVPTLLIWVVALLATQQGEQSLRRSIEQTSKARVRAVMDEIDRAMNVRISGWRAYAESDLVKDTLRASNAELERMTPEAREAYQRGALTNREFFSTVAGTFNGAYSPEEVERVHGAWILREYEGVGGLIEALNGAGVRTACLSNTNDGHWRMLETWDAVAALGSRHASHLMELAKPDEAIYRLFEEREGVRGDSVLFFEDTAANAEAARAIGWRAEVVDPSEETRPQIETSLRAHGVTW